MKVKVKTSVGNFEISLFTEKAPITTTNFVSYIEDGFYVNTIFHRVIDGFMIQGGGFTEEMEEKPTRKSIQNEADNGLLNKSLTIAMARTSDPNSATAQFFINLMDNPFLNFTSRVLNFFKNPVQPTSPPRCTSTWRPSTRSTTRS